MILKCNSAKCMAGDRVYDPAIHPEAFTVKAGVEERPGSE